MRKADWLRLPLGALVLAGTPAMADAVVADTAPAEFAEVVADEGGSGDIVVTARRRAENVQEVPIALSFVGGAQLDSQGLFNNTWTAAQRGVQASQFFQVDYSDWNLSYGLNLAYELASDINAYATYTRSFKTGGVNLNGVPSLPSGLPALGVAVIKPEKVDHFEAGLKTQFWNRAATLNISAFWTAIKDFQASVISNVSGSNVLHGYLANAEKVRTRSIEADFSVRPSERFNGYVNGAFTDHEFVKFVDAPCPPELAGGGTGTPAGPAATPGANSPANCDVSGQWLPGISKWAFSWGGEYNVPAKFLGRDGEVYAGYDANYRSTISSNASRSIYTDIDGYSVHNFRVGFRTDNFDAFGWVRNAFDQNVLESLAVTPGNTGLISAQLGDPRTGGGTIKFEF